MIDEIFKVQRLSFENEEFLERKLKI